MTGSSAHTAPSTHFRGFLDSDGSTRSVKLPLANYFSVDGTSAEESWAPLMRCEGFLGTNEEEFH